MPAVSVPARLRLYTFKPTPARPNTRSASLVVQAYRRCCARRVATSCSSCGRRLQQRGHMHQVRQQVLAPTRLHPASVAELLQLCGRVTLWLAVRLAQPVLMLTLCSCCAHAVRLLAADHVVRVAESVASNLQAELSAGDRLRDLLLPRRCVSCLRRARGRFVQLAPPTWVHLHLQLSSAPRKSLSQHSLVLPTWRVPCAPYNTPCPLLLQWPPRLPAPPMLQRRHECG